MVGSPDFRQEGGENRAHRDIYGEVLGAYWKEQIVCSRLQN
jgi:hypothetical protein